MPSQKSNAKKKQQQRSKQPATNETTVFKNKSK